MRFVKTVWTTAIIAATACGLARGDVPRGVAAHGPGGAARPSLQRGHDPRLSPDDVAGNPRDGWSAPTRGQPDPLQRHEPRRDAEPSSGASASRTSSPPAALRSTPARHRLALEVARDQSPAPSAKPAAWFGDGAANSLSTMIGGLAIAVGLFLLFAWAVHKRMPKGSARLPDEIIEVLGRTTLVAKQSLHLVRVGGKLIVVSVTGAGTETLTEITDPGEVARILSACQQHHIHSSTAAFRQVFDQFGREPASGFLGAQTARTHYGREGTGTS